jgi:hypothetical protein
MDEQPRRYRNLLALLWLPLALAIVVPAVVLLGLSFYVRTAAMALAGLIKYLFGYKSRSQGGQTLQPPHKIDAGVPAKEKQD